MNEDQRRELLLLADGLGTVPPERFVMGFWRRKISRDSDCEFAGCAIGWAPHFIPNCGLELVEYQDPPDGLYYPVYKGQSVLDAVSLYFGISERASEFLFLPRSYFVPGKSLQEKITPARVAERIRSFLAIPKEGDDE